MPHAMSLSNRFNTSKLATSCGADALSQLDKGHFAPRTLQILQSLLTDTDTPAHMQHTQEQTCVLRRMCMEQDRRSTPSVSVPRPFVTWGRLQRAHVSHCSSTVRPQHGYRREQVSPKSTFTMHGCGSDFERRARRSTKGSQ